MSFPALPVSTVEKSKVQALNMASDLGWVGPDILLPGSERSFFSVSGNTKGVSSPLGGSGRVEEAPARLQQPECCHYSTSEPVIHCSIVIPLVWELIPCRFNSQPVIVRSCHLLTASLCQALCEKMSVHLFSYFLFWEVQTYIKVVKIVQRTPIDLDLLVHILSHLLNLSLCFSKPFQNW